MAAEMVIWENLNRTLEGLDRPQVASLPPLREELDRLLDAVRGARGAVAALEVRDQIHGRLGIFQTLHDQPDDPAADFRRSRLGEFSTLLHQADDLLDQIMTSGQRTPLCRGVNNQRHLIGLVVNAKARLIQEVSLFLSSFNQLFSSKVAGQVKEIRKNIENSVEVLNEPDRNNHSEPRQLEHIGSFIPTPHKMIGRDNDKNHILGMLLQPPKDRKSELSVICMSGPPGVGKSALADVIYEDHKVKSHFDLRMWIPVSQIADETEIIRAIVESCTNRRWDYYDLQVQQNDTISFRDLMGCRSSTISASSPINIVRQNEINIYERRLRNEIRGKLYLLILDDVDVVCLQKWQNLKKLLGGGARGSQILMITRSTDKAADLVKRENDEVKHCQLQGLNKKHSWALFKSLVTSKQDDLCGFPSKNEMKNTGYKIAEACEHVPLTIKVAARLLQGKSNAEWFKFTEELRLSRELKEDAMEHVLRLSYFDLPIRLRACFGYCSLFPDDFTFNKHDLISLWIAQGFVEPQDNQSLEEAGEKYFMELSRRCLFEEVSTDDLGNILTCKMHHILCSLASIFMAGVASIQVTDSCTIQIPNPKYKHVSLNCQVGSSLRLASPLLNGPSVRTLIFFKETGCDIKVDTLVSNQLISACKRLRVLDLRDIGVKELPDSISEQIHLRYLDLSKNDGLATLPKSFTRLYKLQTLKLNSCPKLEGLASDFGLLANLKRFEVDGCESLTSMPLGLGKLTQLETLSRFVVGNGSSKQTASVGLKVLSRLTMLRGRLTIEMTGDWMPNIPEAKHALCTKENLVEVKISWAEKKNSDIQVQSNNEILDHAEILENLKPNANLKILCIEGYKGKDFPSWAKNELMTSLPNLVIISIEGCSECQILPPFGELVHLKKLSLRHMTKVQYVEHASSLEAPVEGSQEPMQDRPLFQSLQELTLHNFYSLEGWHKNVTGIQRVKTQSFPRLTKLRIWNCPKLTAFPSFTKVSDLNLRNFNCLLLEECAKKESWLRTKYCTTSLHIKGCLNLECFGAIIKGLGGLPLLEHLVIDSCDALISLADDVARITSLKRLEISGCKELDLSVDSNVPGRRQIAFKVPNILPSPWKNLKSLHDLKLKEIPKMERLPEGLRHVRTLKTLSISACQSLGSLPDWISSLISLQHLRIESCRALKRLPEGLKDITSLMKVEITECPELMKRCREHKGEDWPKIKHARVLLHKSLSYSIISG